MLQLIYLWKRNLLALKIEKPGAYGGQSPWINRQINRNPGEKWKQPTPDLSILTKPSTVPTRRALSFSPTHPTNFPIKCQTKSHCLLILSFNWSTNITQPRQFPQLIINIFSILTFSNNGKECSSVSSWKDQLGFTWP